MQVLMLVKFAGSRRGVGGGSSLGNGEGCSEGGGGGERVSHFSFASR